MSGQTIILRGDIQRQLAKRLIDAAPADCVVTIAAPRRSNDQNAKMHAMLSDVARAKPEGRSLPVDTWKALLMHDAGFKCTFEPSLDGQGVVPLGFKSSRLRKAEFSGLIENIYAYGSRCNIRWSEPKALEKAA